MNFRFRADRFQTGKTSGQSDGFGIEAQEAGNHRMGFTRKRWHIGRKWVLSQFRFFGVNYGLNN